jgi:ADP-ribose pyrophosphatase
MENALTMAIPKDDTTHYQGRYLTLKERGSWEFVTRSNANGVVILAAMTDDRDIVLVEQFRPPVRRRVIELPAGLIGDQADPDESVLDAAARELEEETGYRAGALDLVLTCPGSAGMSDEQLYFIVASELKKVGPGGGDASEEIQVHLVPDSQIHEWLTVQLESGKTIDPKIYAGLYWLARKS